MYRFGFGFIFVLYPKLKLLSSVSVVVWCCIFVLGMLIGVVFHEEMIAEDGAGVNGWRKKKA